jgi:oxygen-independent coproporphyrinogen III oxidase
MKELKEKQHNLGIYIHIPFCIKKCSYCNFYSIKDTSNISSYIDALINEISCFSRNLKNKTIIDTIYIGGGTPSVLKIKDLERILNVIDESFLPPIKALEGKLRQEATNQEIKLVKQTNRFRIKPGMTDQEIKLVKQFPEITMEINPGTVNLEYLKQLKALGINRLSIGVQSFNDQELKLLGRIHNSLEAEECIKFARKAGFNNLSIDIMSALPNQKMKDYENTLKKVLSFNPEHISSYVLKLEKGTPLYGSHCEEVSPTKQSNGSCGNFGTTEDIQASYIEKTVNILTKNGFEHYEISSFSKSEKFKSKHNMRYWQCKPYLGFGAAAHSFFDNKRWGNKADVKEYIDSYCNEVIGDSHCEEALPTKQSLSFSETLTPSQINMEKVFLGLRTNEGAEISLINNKNYIEELIKNKFAYKKDNKLILTEKGFLVYNEIVLSIV